jgi:hypothetical protein
MAGDLIGLAKYTDLVKSLKAGSIGLDDLANDFLGDARKAAVDIVCYYETENTAALPDWNVGSMFKTGVCVCGPCSLIPLTILRSLSLVESPRHLRAIQTFPGPELIRK